MFQAVVGMLSTLGPFLLAIGTILWIGFRSKPDRRWGLIAWGATLLVLPILGMGVMIVGYQIAPLVASPTPGRPLSPGELRSVGTRQLIEQHLPNRIDEPWVWNVLEDRVQTGQMSQQDVDDAIGTLITHIKTTRPKGWDRPLSWQDEFLEAAAAAGLISEPVLLDLCDAFFGPKPLLRPLPRVREGQAGLQIEMEYGSTWSDNAGLPLELLWDVNRVLLDGKPLEVRQTSRHREGWSGYHDGSLPAGDYEMTVEVQCAYVDRAKLIGLQAHRLPVERWPQARKQWKQTVSAPLKVYPADERIVGLSTNSALDPGRSGGVKVERLVVQADEDGKKRIILRLAFSEGLSIPLSYDVSAVLEDQRVNLGSTWVVEQPDRRSTGPGQLQKQIDALDPAVKRADVILTPNPRHIDSRPEVSEIWGEKTIIKDVLIERLDLETAQGAGEPTG
jgi:hypothetical protein